MTDQLDADVIIVGSGFGGAVAAARLAQAGRSVLVVERGRRWKAGEFPRDADLDKGWLWKLGGGLFDVRWLDRMASVHAAGWGGGSLVYANVFARPSDKALDSRWPAHMRRDVLDPYYDLAAHMLEVSPTTPDPRTGRLPDRTTLVEELVERSDIADATVRPNLAVTFGDPDRWRPNIHGVARRGCAFVGECVLGCNQGAKNSLDHNYLAVAEAAGAQAITDAQVDRIESCDGGYAVFASKPSDPQADERVWRAAEVVLAAGAVGTTELLLRARDVHRTMPNLSRRLGHGFSGNGDFLTFARLRGESENTSVPGGDMTTGPTITTTTVLDVPEGRRSVWYQVQDGAFPLPMRDLIESLVPGRRVRAWWKRIRRYDPRRGFVVLAMGRDSADGTLRLDKGGEVTLSWRARWQAQLHRSQARVGPIFARQFGARISNPPTWSLFRRTTTVHALGGVPEGRDGDAGVVDEYGEVHGYPGLYVMDGARLPAAVGVNPSATILAVAERSVESIIRRSGRKDWRAPEWGAVKSASVPEDAAFEFMADWKASTAGDGIMFSERMKTPKGRGSMVDMTLRAEIRSMDRFLRDPSHPISITGKIDVEGVTTGAEVTGTLSLFPDGGTEAMAYALRFTGEDGRDWELSGTKTVVSRNPMALLRGLTTLDTRIRPAASGPGEADTRLVTISFPELLRLGTSIRGQGFTRARRIRVLVRFAGFFTRSALRRPASSPHRRGQVAR